MSDFAYILDQRFAQHAPEIDYPESPERLDAVQRGLSAAGISESTPTIPFEPAEYDALTAIHAPDYLDRLRQAGRERWAVIDAPDCPLSPQSIPTAWLAAGAAIAATRAVATGTHRRAFCALRPPGHHAEHDAAMGFCFLNNIALAARTAQREGLERVAIVDFDVHHGNGTQHAFEEDPTVLFISTHGDPTNFYPHSGFAHERGRGAGEGTTLNLPLPLGTTPAQYQQAFTDRVLPALHDFAPDILLLSAGFDAHRDDPLGILALDEPTFTWITQQLRTVSEQHGAGRCVSFLEGGYNLAALERSVTAHVRELL
jgi:acetoin utilization deacetylase AcuC-like enzyme